MKPLAKDGPCRNVLPLLYRVQIHMNLRDHRHLSVNQVRVGNCAIYFQFAFECHFEGIKKGMGVGNGHKGELCNKKGLC